MWLVVIIIFILVTRHLFISKPKSPERKCITYYWSKNRMSTRDFLVFYVPLMLYTKGGLSFRAFCVCFGQLSYSRFFKYWCFHTFLQILDDGLNGLNNFIRTSLTPELCCEEHRSILTSAEPPGAPSQ